MIPRILHRVTPGARWVLLSCGCQVTLHGGATAPAYCPDCRKFVTSSAA
jgi:hypothetical protein